MSMFDMRLSDLEYLQPPSANHKRSKTMQSKPSFVKHQRKRTVDEGNVRFAE